MQIPLRVRKVMYIPLMKETLIAIPLFRIPRRNLDMSAKLDTVRDIWDMDTYLKKVINHLEKVDGTRVTITLEVNKEAPKGTP